MKIIDFFAGMGGIKLGVLQAFSQYSKQAQCIAWSDIKKESLTLYPQIWGKDLPNLWDITKINPKALPDFDIFLWGFPCQSYSMAGKRLWLNDTRGQLIYNIFDILEEKKPKIIFLENVKGITTIDWGQTIADIMQKFVSLGYSIEYYILNSKDFWVAQSRQRIYFVGFHESYLSEEKAEQIHLQIKKAIKYHTPTSVTLEDVIDFSVDEETLKPYYLNNKQSKMTVLKDAFCWSIKGIDDISNGLTKTYWHITGQSTKLAYNTKEKRYLNKKEVAELFVQYQEESEKLKIFKDNLKKRGLSIKEKNKILDEYFESITLPEYLKLRIFTPRECLKLQGFPKEYQDKFLEIWFKDKECYSLIGDGVSVPVIQYLWNLILSNL